ncbi:hypothetical protein BG004_003209 [Podila humilis]|nr:hypothetical protein BG004_003209 [Podila humilis]
MFRCLIFRHHKWVLPESTHIQQLVYFIVSSVRRVFKQTEGGSSKSAQIESDVNTNGLGTEGFIMDSALSTGDDRQLPMDVVIQVFMHLAQCPQDLLNCALTTRAWTRSAFQELYRHPWTFLFTYQFDTEGRVADKHGSVLLLRTLFQGCMDPSRTAFPYASFARSVNLKWVHDTFDFPEVDIQTLTGLRWTRNEAPKDYLIRHLLSNRPYLTDFVHCHAPRLPRCLFAHGDTDAIAVNNDDGSVTATATADLASSDSANLNTELVSNADTANTAPSVSSNVETVGTDMEWIAFTQESGSDEFDYTGSGTLGSSLLTTPPLLPVQPPQATFTTAVPLAYPAGPHVVEATVANVTPLPTPTPTAVENAQAQASFLQALNAPPSSSGQGTPAYHSVPSPISLSLDENQEMSDTVPVHSASGGPIIEELSDVRHESNEQNGAQRGASSPVDVIQGLEDMGEDSSTESQSSHAAFQSLPAAAASESETIPHLSDPMLSNDAFTNTDIHTHSHHSRANTSSSVGSSSSRLFLGAWPLTMCQTVSLIYVDLRYAIVSDALIVSLSKTCQRIESLKVATRWQQFLHSYSVTDRALAILVDAQHGLKLLHVENNREISQGHMLAETINVLTKRHGPTLQSLVLKSHDFQDCDLAGLGKSCQRLTKFSAPGGTHLLRDEVVKMTEECKLTLEHLDFSNSDIETDCLTRILKGMSTPVAAKGVLKALILLGMEDTLNQETCLAIGEHGSGLDCFRLDILESEARDVAAMLSRSCAMNLRVLTLGCHDVHGDLANEILGQIAANCRNVELLDVNHWQFSAIAIEKVLEECEMLRYLNVSYTDISESTGDVICKCLGELTKEACSSDPASSSSIVSESSSTMFFTPQTSTVTPSNPDLQTPVQNTTLITTGVNSMSMVTPVQHSLMATAEWHHFEELRESFEVDEARIKELKASLDNINNSEQDERIDALRKRGTDAQDMEDENGHGEEDNEEQQMLSKSGHDSTKGTEMDLDTRYISSNYSTNGITKKQSQMGLFHHRPLSAMDLETIMNLDLDEVDDVDLDMCVDLRRYHRNSSSFRDREYVVDDDGDIVMGVDEYEEHDQVEEKNDAEEEGEREEFSNSGGEEEEEGMQVPSKQSKGKEVHTEYFDKSCHHPGSDIVHSVSHFSVYSTSFESYVSGLSSSSSASSSSSSASSMPSTSSMPFLDASGPSKKVAGPLLPPLPIPSRQEDDQSLKTSLPAVATTSGAEGRLHSTSSPLLTPVFSIDTVASMAPLGTPADITSTEDLVLTMAETPTLTAGATAVIQSNTSSLIDVPQGSVESSSSSALTGSDKESTSTASGPSTAATAIGTVAAGVAKDVPRDLSWTMRSRLEQVNVECCSHLSFSTMTRIKILATAAQAKRPQQGHKKSCRIWAENEHDMMMTRLATERGPPPSRAQPQETGTTVVTAIEEETGGSGGPPRQDRGQEQATEEQGIVTHPLEVTAVSSNVPFDNRDGQESLTSESAIATVSA